MPYDYSESQDITGQDNEISDRVFQCSNCGRAIKRTYDWKDKVYGIECWKKIALPEIEKKRLEKWLVKQEYKHNSNLALIYTLQAKDMSRIKSKFVKEFIPSVIEQFLETGTISQKQDDIIHGRNGYYGMLNQTDDYHDAVFRIIMGICDPGWLYQFCYLDNTDVPKEDWEKLGLEHIQQITK